MPKVEPGRAVRRRCRAVRRRRRPRAVRRRVVSCRRDRAGAILWPLPLEVDVAPLLLAVAASVIAAILVPSKCTSKWSVVSQ